MKTQHPRNFESAFQSMSKESIPRKTQGMDIGIEKGEGVVELQGKESKEYIEFVGAVNGKEYARQFEVVCKIAQEVAELGGRALLVGGCVRDEILGLPAKDFDIEIYGLKQYEIDVIVEQYGTVNKVGKAFGITKLSLEKEEDDETIEPIDISMPRVDSKAGSGHKGFDVKVDPHMSLKDAARRRDFTFNALSKDPLTGIIYDPFGGIEDVRTRTLRITDYERFKDDPLRLLRGAQFVGRFGLRVDPDSMILMQEMVPELAELAAERVGEEWSKLLLKGLKPSMSLHALREIGVIDRYYPELAAIEDVEQEYDWHPEGDVWIHTLMVVDAAAEVIRREKLSGEDAQVIMFASLCHDLGKPETTTFEDGRIRSKKHEAMGEGPTKAFLKKLKIGDDVVKAIVACVKEHLWPGTMYRRHQKYAETGNAQDQVSDGTFRRLALRLHPATIAQLTFVAEADNRGRGPYFDPDHIDQMLLPEPDTAGKWVREKAIKLGIYKEKPKPILQGRDLIALGLFPNGDDGQRFGLIIKESERLRDEKEWTQENILDFIARKKTLKEILEALKGQ